MIYIYYSSLLILLYSALVCCFETDKIYLRDAACSTNQSSLHGKQSPNLVALNTVTLSQNPFLLHYPTVRVKCTNTETFEDDFYEHGGARECAA